jgi:hypothetical protein
MFFADPPPPPTPAASEWWLPWHPVGTGLIVAMVAFVGVLISNRTNRLAIAAADGREVDKWRRDTLLKLCSEAVTASLAVEGLYEQGVKERQSVDRSAIAQAINKIGPAAETMNLLGEVGLMELTRRLDDGCRGIETFAEKFVSANIAYENQLDAFKKANANATPPDVELKSTELRKAFWYNAESDFADSIQRMAAVRGFLIQKASEVLNEKNAPPAKGRRWYLLWLR